MSPTDAKGAAGPIAAPQAASNPEYAVPEQVRALLGPRWLIEGEDPKLYEQLLARVGAAIQPTDIIDWLLLKDIVAITWEIQRSRRQRETIVRMGRLKAMEQVLEQAIPRKGAPAEPNDMDWQRDSRAWRISNIARKWLSGDVEMTGDVVERLKDAGFSLNDIAAQSLTVQANELDRVDSQVQRHEARRDAILQQIERRREGLAQRVRRASEEAVDAEFVEAPSTAVALPANGGEESEA
jgi:hypothetical protein